MIIRLQIKIYSSENLDGFVYQKEYESIDVPVKGSKIVDSIFAEPKTVVNVIHNYQERSVDVFLEDKEVKPCALKGHIQEVADLHKWILQSPSKYT